MRSRALTTRSRSNYAIIPHPENACILLLQERDGWTLPRHTEEGAATINRAIKQTFGLEVTVLYAAYEYHGEQEDGMAAQQIDVLGARAVSPCCTAASMGYERLIRDDAGLVRGAACQARVSGEGG